MARDAPISPETGTPKEDPMPTRTQRRTKSKRTTLTKQRAQPRTARADRRFVLPKPYFIASEREMIDDLKRVARKLRTDTLSAAQYSFHGKFQSRRVISRFTSWSRALAAANLLPARDFRIDHHRLMWNLRQVWLGLKRPPVKEDMARPRSRWSASTYLHRYGGWHRALQAFMRWNKKHGSKAEQFRPGSANDRRAIAQECKKARARQLNIERQRYFGMGVRFKVLERDSFRCVTCGRSPATHPGLALHVDHIKPAARGGKLGGPDFKNLQTLCKECNHGKRDRVMKKPTAKRTLSKT